MRSYHELQKEIFKWSSKNFGQNLTQIFDLHIVNRGAWDGNGGSLPTMMVAVDWLCPLLGLCEELGELVSSKTIDEQQDAIGDVFIFLCDYTSRLEMPLPIGPSLPAGLEEPNADPIIGLVQWVGALQHGILKRIQGIRGFDKYETYESHVRYCIAMIIQYLMKYCKDHFNGVSLLMLANKVYMDTVEKRDWNASKEGGVTLEEWDKLTAEQKLEAFLDRDAIEDAIEDELNNDEN